MTTQSAAADISMRFNRWLDRFTPPRQIAGKPETQQDEANAMLRIFLDHTPEANWQAWFDKAIRTLETSMTTRSWPAPGEVIRACRGAVAEMPVAESGINHRVESDAIERMIDWLGKFKDQMPGMGRPDRTAALIRRGVLKNEREAKFRGFNLSPEQFSKIKSDDQQPSRAEWDHHVAILAKLSNRPVDDVDFELQDEQRQRRDGPFRSIAEAAAAATAAE